MISLSWSRLSTYTQCPRKFQLQFLEKAFPEEEKSIHLIKGEQLHKQLEDYVIAKNGGGEMPAGFSNAVAQTLPLVDGLFQSFSAVYPEAQVSAGKDWKPLEWFDKKTMYRAIWDVIAMRPDAVFLGDYKSGRVYDYGSSFGQLHLSAVMALHRFEVPEVHTAYIYIEHKKVTKFKVTREELPKIQAHFEAAFEKVQMEKEWKPTPNEYCKYCPANKKQCQFSRKL